MFYYSVQIPKRLLAGGVLALYALACTGKTDQRAGGKGRSHSVNGSGVTPYTASMPKYHYVQQSDTLVQVLEVQWDNDTAISYRFVAEDKRDPARCSYAVTDRAVTSYSHSDPEIDEDEEGMAYAAIEYVSDTSALVIRIDMEARDKAIVHIADNTAKHRPAWLPAMSGVLQRQP